MTDPDILESLKQGDHEAEKQLYQGNKRQCVQYAQQHFFWKSSHGHTVRCTREDADELYNDACVVLIQNMRRGRIDQLHVKLSTYLITTMKYAWYNKARGEKKPAVSPALPPSETDREARRLTVHQVIRQLDVKCREMMTYRYILGWEDYEDIAQATGKNNGAVVRNLISRCRKRFRELYVQLNDLSGV